MRLPFEVAVLGIVLEFIPDGTSYIVRVRVARGPNFSEVAIDHNELRQAALFILDQIGELPGVRE